jgi:hypothetical protein
MKLGGSLGNVPQKLKKKIVIKIRYILDCYFIFKSTIYTDEEILQRLSMVQDRGAKVADLPKLQHGLLCYGTPRWSRVCLGIHYPAIIQVKTLEFSSEHPGSEKGDRFINSCTKIHGTWY